MNKKQRILEAALKIVSEKGILSFNITALSKMSGISKPLICYHFENLENIIESLFYVGGELGQQKTVEALNNIKTPTDKIIAIINAAFQWTIDNSNYADFFILMYHLASKNEKLFSANKAISEIGLDRIKLILFEADTDYSKDEIPLLALSIHSLLIGALVRAISLKELENINTYRDSVIMTVKALLR